MTDKLANTAKRRPGEDDDPFAPALSAATCDLEKCADGADRRAQMCLCQRVALLAGGQSFISPAYLRGNFGNFGSDMSRGPVASVCQQLVAAKTIDSKCVVNCNIMHHWIRASPGTDAMVCMKAVEEAELVEKGDIMLNGEDAEDGKREKK
eukprot:g3913.t1